MADSLGGHWSCQIQTWVEQKQHGVGEVPLDMAFSHFPLSAFEAAGSKELQDSQPLPGPILLTAIRAGSFPGGDSKGKKGCIRGNSREVGKMLVRSLKDHFKKKTKKI